MGTQPQRIVFIICSLVVCVLSLTAAHAAGREQAQQTSGGLHFQAQPVTRTVTQTGDSGAGSLRQAILDANAAGEASTISFNIPTTDPGYESATGTFRIRPTSQLPDISTAGTIIDGASQRAFTGDTNLAGPEIVVDGSLAGEANGFVVTASYVQIKALVIHGFVDLLDGDYNKGIGVQVIGRSILEDVRIQGCYIGTDATGTVAMGNAVGIYTSAQNVLIGGTTPETRNIISGNNEPGIAIGGTQYRIQPFNNRVQGNYIGLDASGMRALPNGSVGLPDAGVEVYGDAYNNIIGGALPGTRNIISGNVGDGVRVSTNNTVQGNYIGTDVTGTQAVPNGRDGIHVAFKYNIIGGLTPAQGNRIAFNQRHGIQVASTFAGNNIGNTIRGNAIFGNAGLGIDLQGGLEFNGMTSNRPGGDDNYPVIDTVSVLSGTTTLSGTLNSTPNEVFDLDFYRNIQPDPNGLDEGEQYVGSTTITTDAEGNAGWSFRLDESVEGQRFTATATDRSTPDTSEFYTRIPDILQFEAETYSVQEQNSTATITVTRMIWRERPVTVEYTTSDATATGGNDYTVITGTLSFSTTETSKVFTIPIRDDQLDEADERVKLTLRNPSPDAALGQRTTAELVIRDNDVTPSTFIVRNTNSSGPGSLRQALLDDTGAGDDDTVLFNIPRSDPGYDAARGIFTIQSGTLPSLDYDGTVLDGASQTVFTGDTNPAGPEIMINGTGLVVNGSSNTISNLVIRGGPSILINGSNNTVQGNYIGVDATGTRAVDNSGGIRVTETGDNNLIGGTTSAARNVIAGNSGDGISIVGPGYNPVTYPPQPARPIPVNNRIQGNFIGVDASGTIAIGNKGHGVSILNGAGARVGSADTGAGNVISGNGGAGISLSGSGGGPSSSPAPTTSGWIAGNLIGTDVSGTRPLPNGNSGVIVVGLAGATIGGVQPGARNVISANKGDGIAVSLRPDRGGGLGVYGNYIGTDRTGTLPLGNGGNGVTLDSAPISSVGGIEPGSGNRIAYNGGDGVYVGYISWNTEVRANQIFGNMGLGINLQLMGEPNSTVTLNDPMDADPGTFSYNTNTLQNFPVLTAISVGTNVITVTGTLNSEARQTFAVDFYRNSHADASGYGEGAEYLGATMATTDDNGNATFVMTLPVQLLPGQSLTATATNSNGTYGVGKDTSEFSAAIVPIPRYVSYLPFVQRP